MKTKKSPNIVVVGFSEPGWDFGQALPDNLLVVSSAEIKKLGALPGCMLFARSSLSDAQISEFRRLLQANSSQAVDSLNQLELRLRPWVQPKILSEIVKGLNARNEGFRMSPEYYYLVPNHPPIASRGNMRRKTGKPIRSAGPWGWGAGK